MTRKMEVILTRLRIGHTRLTHGYLMKSPKDETPKCEHCKVNLSVKHIFEDCAKFSNKRTAIFGNKTCREILEDSVDFSVKKIILFLKECNILHEI